MPFLDWLMKTLQDQLLNYILTMVHFIFPKYNVLMNENTFKGANCKLYEMQNPDR